jgi:LuxR family maltose regulon positive regulatory protein
MSRSAAARALREQVPPLLESKLRPPAGSSVTLPRGHLVDRLRAARRTRITLVEAPAGYGKSTLLAGWVRREKSAVGWCSIDEADNEPARFLSYLARALGRAGAPVEQTLDRPSAPEAVTAAIVSELGAALSSTNGPAVLVIDGLHLLRSRVCIGALGVLCQRVPAGVRLVLSTRTSNRPALAHLDDMDAVLRLGPDDLRLSDAEARALVGALGLDLDDDEVRTLNARCEGWAAGLHLIALAGRPAVENACRPGTSAVDRFVADYLRLEVLDRLDAEERELLRRVSVLDKVCGPLCDSLLGTSGSAARLEALARANQFVAADGDEEWYRLHRLMRDTLRAELEAEDAGAPRLLLSRAADWYESGGDIRAAIECAIDAGDRARVAELLPAAALEPYWSGRSSTLGRWLSSIDDARLLAEHPAAAVLGAGLLALLGRPETAERWGRKALENDPDRVMPDGSPVSAWSANLRALLCRDGAEAMREDAELCLATLAEDSRMASNAQCLLGFAHLLLGEDERAAAAFEEAASVAVALGATIGASVSLAAGSLLALDAGDLRRAGELAGRSEEIVRELSLDQYPTTAIVHVASGRVAVAEGRRKAAHDCVERANRLLPQVTYALPWLAVFLRLGLAHLELALDNPARARALLEEIDRIAVHRPDLGVTAERVDRLRKALEAGRSAADGWSSDLTPAELRLLPFLAGYLSFKEISERLGISRNTVKTQAIAVYRKLDVTSRSDAVARARELGLLGSDPVRGG